MKSIWKILSIILISLASFAWCFRDTCDVSDSFLNPFDGELIFAQTIIRHGDRNILELQAYPTSRYKAESHWPGGYGQLTNLGKRQHFALGKYLRKRYAYLLGDGSYSSNKVYVHTTDVDRVIESALSNLAGLFPPTKQQEWKHNFNWNPVPIHMFSKSEDYLLAPSKQCDRFDYAMIEYMKKTNHTKLLEKHRFLINYLESNSGMKISNLKDIVLLFDSLRVEQEKGKVLSDWAEQVIEPCGDMEKLALLVYSEYTATTLMKRLQSGFLLKEILDRFTQKAQSTLTPDRQLQLYFSHDITITNMLNSLGLFEPPFFPPYASCLLFELYKDDGDFNVKIFFKKTPKTKARPLRIPNCGFRCSLEELYELYSDILPTKSHEFECALQENEFLPAGGNPMSYRKQI